MEHRDAQQRDCKLLGPDPATLVRRTDLPRLRGPHDVRHPWTSLAPAAGVHPKVVSGRLGHSTIAITIDTYSHAIPSLDAAATVASRLFVTPEEQ